MNAEDLRQMLQGASRSFWAGGLGAPADMGNTLLNLLRAGYGYAGNKAGLLRADQMPELVQEPVGGSEWFARKMRARGLLNDSPGTTGDTVGSFAGALLPILAGVKAPQIASGVLKAADNLAAPREFNTQAGKIRVSERAGATEAELAVAQRNAAKPITEGGLGLPANNTAADRMAAMKMEPGWFRGGEAPRNGAPTGPWYTSIEGEAADYAARAPAVTRDVREYAISNAGRLKFDGGYPSALANDLAALLEKDGHAAAAKMLRGYYADGSPISGMAAYKFLQRNIGEAAPIEYLQRLGFRSVEGVNSPNYRQVLNDSIVRDARRAAFDPARRAERNIFASSAAAAPIGAALLSEDQPGN